MKNRMKIVDFSSKTFQEIPIQDNPTYMTKKEYISAGQSEGCLLITKQDQDEPPYKNRGRFVVMKITPVDNPMEECNVEMLGLFWDSIHAMNFSKLLTGELFD
jgi:hypothetical protein